MHLSKQIGFCLAIAIVVSCSPSLERERRGTFYITNPAGATCETNDGRDGFCLLQGCRVNDLTPKGRCALLNLGTCCVAEQKCDKSTNANNTYFVSEHYPVAGTKLGICNMTVHRTEKICQIRLDFIDFNLEQPDEHGNCNQDVFTVQGASTHVPRLCGNNNGQHLYINVDPAAHTSPVVLSVKTGEISLTKKKWNIKVTYIECESISKVPKGCHQYYSGVKGLVKSFNFGPATKGTRQIKNKVISICVRQENGYCGISWTRDTIAGNLGFTLSGNASLVDYEDLGSPALSKTECSDSENYVLIASGKDDLNQRSDRVCGLGFPNKVTSNITPFGLWYYTSPTLADDSLNSGFSLNFEQNKC